jgi:hypothetical protein
MGLAVSDTHVNATLRGVNDTTRLKLLVAFMWYLKINRSYAASMTIQHISAIAHYFRMDFQDMGCFAHPSVKAARTAVFMSDRYKSSLADRTRPPTTTEMLLLIVDHYRSSVEKTLPGGNRSHYPTQYDSTNPDTWGAKINLMIAIATTVAFHLMMRVSEYAALRGAGLGNKPDYAMRACNITFYFRNKDDKLQQYPAHKIRQAPPVSTMRNNLDSVRFRFPMHKGDRYGDGADLLIAADGVDMNHQQDRHINPTTAALEWAKTTRLGPEDQFFSIDPQYQPKAPDEGGQPCHPARRVELTPDMMGEAVRYGARQSGCPEDFVKRFTPHSLRVGGSTAYRNAPTEIRLPLEDIAGLGRWKSLGTAHGYQRLMGGFSRNVGKAMQGIHQGGTYTTLNAMQALYHPST